MARLFSRFLEIDKWENPKQFGSPRKPAQISPTFYPGPNGTRIALPTFEFGVVMAGAVSAGAYSAGVLDYLIEALDKWEDAKAADALAFGDDFSRWSVPPHSVRLTAVAGASAGSVCAAILAASSTVKFVSGAGLSPDPDIVSGGDVPRFRGNPLYDVWVERLDIIPMLANADLKIPGLHIDNVESLLNTGPLDAAAQSIISLELPPSPRRPWLEQGVEFGFTLGNLTGIPYRYQLLGLDGADFATRRHADNFGFKLAGSAQPASELPTGCAPGSPYIINSAGATPISWEEVANAALASAAFPVALRPRNLTKNVDIYNRTPVFSSRILEASGPACEAKDTGKAKHADTEWVQGANIVAGTVNCILHNEILPFTAVDGGTMNNQPFEFVRRAVAGPLGYNPRIGNKATRAVVLIDPLPAPQERDVSDSPARAAQQTATPTNSEMQPMGIFKVLVRLMRAYTNQARYDANDLELAADPDVYSRFMLSPVRAAPNGGTLTGAEALASGGLGAFAGFLSRRYRHHDFLLGRRNAEYFLRSYFSLPADNPLFDNIFWSKFGDSKNPRGPYWTITANDDGKHERPIIPVLVPEQEGARHDPATGVTDQMERLREIRKRLISPHPIWPGSDYSLNELIATLEKPLQQRCRAMVDVAFNSLPGNPFTYIAGLFRGRIAKSACNKALETIEKELRSAGLGTRIKLPAMGDEENG